MKPIVDMRCVMVQMWTINYMMQPQFGGGMYLEYHTDKPHHHFAVTPDASGFHILAKPHTGGNGDGDGTITISAPSPSLPSLTARR